jgi:hypothetical protein
LGFHWSISIELFYKNSKILGEISPPKFIVAKISNLVVENPEEYVWTIHSKCQEKRSRRRVDFGSSARIQDSIQHCAIAAGWSNNQPKP